MRKAVLMLCLLCLPAQTGCSLSWLFNLMFDNPHAGGNGSAADRARTMEWEEGVVVEWDQDREIEQAKFDESIRREYQR